MQRVSPRMTFYFNRETGQRVSKSTWARSKAHGGTRFVRRSTPKEQTLAPSEHKAESLTPFSGTTPSQNPHTYQEYLDYFRSLSKRRRRQIEEYEEYEGPEYETGVDY